MYNVQGTGTLLSEANHRIANSMAAIAGVVRLQATNEARVSHLRSPAEVRVFLNEIGAKIDAAAHLHRFLAMSEHASELEVTDFIRNVARSAIGANAVSGSTVLVFDGRAECVAPADAALSIGLIVVELVTNALKYAHPAGVPGTVLVKVEHEDGVLTATVADDGVGLPEAFDWTSENSLGYRLIRSLTRQLGGQFNIESGDIGVRAVLSAPCRTPVHSYLHSVEPEPA